MNPVEGLSGDNILGRVTKRNFRLFLLPPYLLCCEKHFTLENFLTNGVDSEIVGCFHNPWSYAPLVRCSRRVPESMSPSCVLANKQAPNDVALARQFGEHRNPIGFRFTF